MSDVSVDATVNLSFRGLRGSRSAFRDLERNITDSTTRGFRRGLQNSDKVLSTVSKMIKGGMTDGAVALREAAREVEQNMTSSRQEIRRLSREIRRETHTNTKKRLIAERQALKEKIKTEEKALDRRLKRENEAADRRIALLERADKRSNRTRLENAKLVGNELNSQIENLGNIFSSGSIDTSSLASGIANALSGALDIGAGKMAQGGMGGAAAKLSMAAGAIAASAAAIGAVAGMFALAYGQTKEFNEEIMSTTSAVDMMGMRMGDMNGKLKEFRNNAIDLAMATRMETKEVLTAMNAFNEAGLNLELMGSFAKGAGDDMTKLADASRSAILAAKGLGIEVSDFAGFAKTFRDMGHSLSDVQGAFGMIAMGAEKAGMTTKSFFTAINEASTGMSLYNFRVGDTVGLLSDMVGILGEDLAKSKLALEKTFGTMGFQERYKTVLTTGKGRTGKILKADAQAQAEEFGKKFAGVTGLNKVGGPESINIKALGKMNEKSFQSLLSGMHHTDKRQEDLAKQQLQTLYNISKGTRGGTTAKAMALGSVSKTAELAMQLSAGSALTGGKQLAEAAADPVTRMLLEEQLGMDAETIEQNIRLERAFRSEFQNMKMTGQIEPTADFYEELAKGTLSNSNLLENMQDISYSMLERMGLDTLEETKSIGNTLKTVIVGLLEKMSGFLDMIAGFLAIGDAAKAERKEIQDRYDARMKKYGLMSESQSKVSQMEKELLAEKDFSKRDEIKQKIKQEKAYQKKLKKGIETDTEVTRAMSKGVDKNAFGIAKTDTPKHLAAKIDFKSKYGMTPMEYYNSLSETEQRSGSLKKFTASSTEQVTGMADTVEAWKSMGAVNIDGKQQFLSKAEVKAGSKYYGRGPRGTGEFSKQEIMDAYVSAAKAYQEKHGTAEMKKQFPDILTAGGGVKGGAAATAGKSPTDPGFVPGDEMLAAIEETAAADPKMIKIEEDLLGEAEDQTTALENIETKLGEDDRTAIFQGLGGSMSNEKFEENMKTRRGRIAIANAIRDSGATKESREAALAKLRIGRELDDFIYRGDGSARGGTINPIDDKDVPIAFGKPGGALSRLGGGVVINISGVGSADEVARVVTSTMKKLGMGSVKTYSG